VAAEGAHRPAAATTPVSRVPEQPNADQRSITPTNGYDLHARRAPIAKTIGNSRDLQQPVRSVSSGCRVNGRVIRCFIYKAARRCSQAVLPNFPQLSIMSSIDTPSTSFVIPSTQTVWCAVRKGTPETGLERDTNAPVATQLQPGDVLVKVDAAALNPVGYKLLGLAPNWFANRPYVNENDLAGTVVQSESPSHHVGERVFGYIPVPLQIGKKTKEGALAQYTRLPGDHVARVPDRISTVDAAGLALAGETALQCLVNFAGVEAGQTVLINGGSSGVGVLAVQMAKALGCTVWSSASGKNEEFVKSYGADVVRIFSANLRLGTNAFRVRSSSTTPKLPYTSNSSPIRHKPSSTPSLTPSVSWTSRSTLTARRTCSLMVSSSRLWVGRNISRRSSASSGRCGQFSSVEYAGSGRAC